MITERIRTVSTLKSTCGSCKNNNVYIGYDEGLKFYCSKCAFNYGAIDDAQYHEDLLEEEIVLKTIKNREKGV